MPWVVRSNGCTGYFNRWNGEQNTHTHHFARLAAYKQTVSKAQVKILYRGSGLASIIAIIGLSEQGSQKADNSSQVHRSMEDTSISTANTDTHNTSSDHGSNRQGIHTTDGCSTAQQSEQQAKPKKTAEPTSPMATTPTHHQKSSIASTTTRERDDTIADGSTRTTCHSNKTSTGATYNNNYQKAK